MRKRRKRTSSAVVSSYAKGAIGIFFLLFLAMTIIPPAFFGPQPNTSKDFKVFGNRAFVALYNYQTLLTGIAAVCAAFITVRAMREETHRSDERHDELMELQERPDKLRVERLLVPTFSDLRVLHMILGQFEERRRDLTREEAVAVGSLLLVQWDNLAQVVQTLADIINRSEWVGAKSLFGGNLTAYASTLASRIADIQALLAYVDLKVDNPVYRSSEQVRADTQYDIATEVPPAVYRLRNSIAPVVDELRVLAGLYDVEI